MDKYFKVLIGLIFTIIGLVFLGNQLYNYIKFIRLNEEILSACACCEYDVIRAVLPNIIIGFVFIIVGIIVFIFIILKGGDK